MTQRLYNFNPGVNQNDNDSELLTQYDDITNQTPTNTLLNTTSTISGKFLLHINFIILTSTKCIYLLL